MAVAIEKQGVKGTAYTGDDTVNKEEKKLKKSAAERKLLLKTDLVVVPLAALIYFTAYLDRNSIGLANVMGLSKDLHLTGNEYYNCLMMFYVGYILFMLPGNIGLRVLPPHYILGGSALLFGTFLTASSCAHGYATVLSMRVLLGAVQAFIQGLGLYVTMWYKRDEVATRAAIYYSAATISGAFSGLIAYGIQKSLTLERTGREPWRWLFIIEGCMALFVGLLVVVSLPRFPDQFRGNKHWLFRPEEIELAVQRMRSYNTVGAKVNLKQIWSVLKDPKCWLFVLINAGVALGIGSVGLFLPTFVKEFGFDTEKTLLFSVIPYACATVVLPILAKISDRVNGKGFFLLGCLSVVSVGYILLMAVSSTGVKIFAACLITSGLYPSVIFLVTWLGVNTGGFTKRGTTWALAEVFGQCFSILGTHIYNGPPRFIKGHAIVLGFIVLGVVNATILLWWMSRENKRRDAIEKDYRDRGEVHPHAPKSLEEMQDFHISFRYIL
ncbi:uncharacterized protein Z518_05840 [Rhinocladiella mackenziei CBS 650.93]|uniref:Major facilitator superfamily (MFS) profile domain-containing protein n=1 Tax=Rhinocladiella mackenziei CBS 650.93 TaxID=1442369 RepID=A0A0D2H3I7_9EURO|nr:uncharacterized protein Z518_05840 [Rhinocladiella mackenziei CBS 650.93]KIX04968.1 hypothetical protein Z518_05840 [Rhinocladiella mackenziei CBS 650.93]